MLISTSLIVGHILFKFAIWKKTYSTGKIWNRIPGFFLSNLILLILNYGYVIMKGNSLHSNIINTLFNLYQYNSNQQKRL